RRCSAGNWSSTPARRAGCWVSHHAPRRLPWSTPPGACLPPAVRERAVQSQYCERTGPGLWAEPLNAVSNVAFLIACAALLWLGWRPRLAAPGRGAALAGAAGGGGGGGGVWLLRVLLGVVGLCSLSFHTFADPWTEALDSLSILAFVLVG